ncbi:peptidase [Micromonospora sp. NPDC050397]|uniref:peptidase n=1 Tax=Micromonospora sp. NPDC050397 TaxID=3364279 RepID=UPI00385127CC
MPVYACLLLAPSWPTGWSLTRPCSESGRVRPRRLSGRKGTTRMVSSVIRRYRLFSLLLCGALAAVGAVGSSATAAPPTLQRGDAAAGWLARQMVDGERFEVSFDGLVFPDQGLTIDAVFAFAAAKVADEHAARATAWLARPEILSGYVGDGAVEAYAGATAKLALAVQVRGADPATFGGVDLVARLRGLQAPSGRFSDRSAYGDYSNAFSQSLALLALDRTPAGAPPVAVSFLAGSRCADGGYPLLFDQVPCVSDVDATALAVQALQATGRPIAAAAGLGWLAGVQDADGGFVNAGGEPNANSTGLAGQALRVGGRPVAEARAKVFLLGLQIGCPGAAADRGAIAYTPAGFDPSTAVRATAQGVLGLTGAGFADLSSAGARPAAPVLACR